MAEMLQLLFYYEYQGSKSSLFYISDTAKIIEDICKFGSSPLIFVGCGSVTKGTGAINDTS